MSVDKRIDLLEKVVDSHEQLLATLIACYTEMVAMTETLAAKYMGDVDESQQAEFLNNFNKVRVELLKHLEKTTIDLDADSPELFDAVQALFDEQQSDPSSERASSDSPD